MTEREVARVRCCRYPGPFRRAWLTGPPFRAVLCERCGEVTATCGAALQIVWRYTFGLFWRGEVLVERRVHDIRPNGQSDMERFPS
ncbi:MAG: hypothetical protein KGK07_07450 [Chloroflexota bacterium]|nr:hypothetical protein [Chloroflexota bacterium]